MDRERWIQLHKQRSDLKHAGRLAEAICIAEEIVALAKSDGDLQALTHAWNYLSTLQYAAREYDAAELSALEAIATYRGVEPQQDEQLGCYHRVLAQTLACQGRFAEAVAVGQDSIRHYAVFHHPPDDFLRRIMAEVDSMERCRCRRMPSTRQARGRP